MKKALLCWKAGTAAELLSLVRAKRNQSPGAQPSGDAFRLAFAYAGETDFKAKMEKAEALLASGASSSESGGIYFQKVESAPSIAFLYPGQGSQAVNMLAGFRAALPAFESHLQRLDALAGMIADDSLLCLIYGDAKAPVRPADERLRDTRNAQPALGIVETALRLTLESFGVRARFHAGHSYGELAALCGAGFLNERLLLKLSFERGRLLAAAGERAPGAMLALAAAADEARALCNAVDPRLEIVNYNSPRQVVAAGSLDSIRRLEQAADHAGVAAKRLNTMCAFHSSLMAPVAAEWRQYLESALRDVAAAPNATAFSNVTARAYSHAAEMTELLGNQIVSPVRWTELSANLLEAGANIFIEVGPGKVLSDLVNRNGGGRPLQVLTLDPFHADAGDHMSDALARLAAAGVDITEAPAQQPAAVLSEPARPGGYFQANGEIIQRYFAQQTSLVEAALRAASPAERISVTQAAIAANQKIMSEFLAAHEAIARSLLGGGVPAPPAAVAAPPLPANVALPQPAARREPQVEERVDLQSRVETALRAAIADTTGFPPTAIGRNDSFNNLGIDSLTMAEIWIEVANRVPEVAAFADRVHEIRCLSDVSKLAAAPGQARAVDLQQAPPASPPGGETSAACSSGPHQQWTAVREKLVAGISTAIGVDASAISAATDFEHDLGLDVFRREDIFRDHLYDHPRFGQAGSALLNCRTLDELDRLLARFDGPPREERRGFAEPVDRFVLREERVPLGTQAPPLPRSVLLVSSAPSADTDSLAGFFASRGIAVAGTCTVDELAAEPLDAKQRKASALIFIAQGEADCAEFFRLAKHLWGRGNRLDRFTRVIVIGNDTCDPGTRGIVGVARSLRRELSQPEFRTVWLRASSLSETREDVLLTALFSKRAAGDVYVNNDGVFRESLVRTAKQRSKETAMQLSSRSRILVLGGGSGISAEIAVGLAGAYGCEIVAVGRTPWPETLPYSHVADGADFDQRLKAAVLSDGAGAPAEILQQRWKLVSRQRALWSTKTRIEAAGGRFAYVAADAADRAALTAAIEAVLGGGPIHGVVHGAGVASDNTLSRKSLAEFRSVVDTKAVPVRVLRSLLANEPLQFVLFLSSMTSFTGTAGQTDYAAANEIMNASALAWNDRAPYPVKSLLWSVWTEAGLASPVLKRHMARMGLGGISTTEGVGLLLEELRHGQKAEAWLLFAPQSTLSYAMQPQSASVLPSEDQAATADTDESSPAYSIKTSA